MNKIKKALFVGRVGRKHYFWSYLIFSIVFIIIIQIAKESGVVAYIITFSIGLLISTILDAKRLRDVRISGKVAPIAVILFLVTWIPNTYNISVGIQSSFKSHPFLSLMTIFLIVGHIYLLFSKSDQVENKYGKPPSGQSFMRALSNT